MTDCETFEKIPQQTISEDKMNFAQVIFQDIREHYQIGMNFECKYSFSSAMEYSSKDWVGLYKVGWSNAKEYIYYEWAKKPDDKLEAEVTFPASCIPNDDTEIYQFCYITSAGSMRGASMPFQFQSFSQEELIQVEDDTGLLIVKKRTNVLEEQLSKVMKEKEIIYNQLEETRQLNFQNEKKIIELQSEKIQLQMELEVNMQKYKEDNCNLEKDLDECRQILKDKANALSLAKNTEDELKNQVALLERELEMVDKKETEMLRQTDKVQGENKNLYEKIELLDSELAERSQKEENYMKKLNELINKKKRVESDYLILQKTHDETQMRLRGELNVSKQYKEDISNLSERIANYEDKLSAADESKAIMRKELSTVKEFNNKLNSNVEHFVSQNSDLKSRLRELEKLLEDQSKEKNRAVEEERQKFRSMKDQYERLRVESKEMVLDGSRAALQTAYDEVRSRYTKIKKENNDIKKENNDIKKFISDIENLNKDYEIRESSLIKENDDLKRRLSMAGEEYRNKYVEWMKLQKQFSKLEKKADLTESTLKVNTSFSDVICEAYVCSSDSICQTNDEEIEETSLARELKELKLEKKHTDRHLERVKAQAAESQSTIEKLNNELVEKQNELEEMHKKYCKKISESDEMRNTLIDKRHEENAEQMAKEKLIAVRIPVTDYSTGSHKGLPEPLEPVKLHTAKAAAVKHAHTSNAHESNWVFPSNTGPPYPPSGNMFPEVNDHEDDRFQDAMGEPQHLCPVCNHTFLLLNELETHVAAHNFEKTCPFCSTIMESMSQEEFEEHVNECMSERV